MLKTLWIMRHGLAVDRFDSDFSRQLSDFGRLQVLDVAEQLVLDSEKLPTDMLVSPFARTQSTAQIIHQKLALAEPFRTEEMLVHFADHKILGDYLLSSDYQNLMIVSHMPIVGDLCQYLSPYCEVFGFKTAQLVRMDFEQNAQNLLVGNISRIYLANH